MRSQSTLVRRPENIAIRILRFGIVLSAVRSLSRSASLTLLAATFATSVNPGHAENWPGWRGPRGDGTSREESVPIHWDGTSNFVWRTVLPGFGHASPIVWGDRIFTVTALPDTQERLLLCLDRKSGSILWRQTVLTTLLEP